MNDPVETWEDDATGVVTTMRYDDPSNPREDYDGLASLTQLDKRYSQPDSTSDPRILDACSGRGYFRDNEIVERYARAFLGAVAVAWAHTGRGEGTIFGYLTREECEREKITDPQACLDAILGEYRAWAEGDVYGIETEGPGVDESCWGYIGYSYARGEAERQHADATATVHAERAESFRRIHALGSAS